MPSRTKANVGISGKRWLTYEEAMAYTSTCDEHFRVRIRSKLKYVYSTSGNGVKVGARDHLLFDKNEIDALFMRNFRYRNPYLSVL